MHNSEFLMEVWTCLKPRRGHADRPHSEMKIVTCAATKSVIASMFLSRRNPELISVVSRNPEWIPSSQLKSQIRTRDQSRVHPEAKIPFTRLRCTPALSETEEMRVDFIFVLYCDEFICSYSNNNYVQMLCTFLVSAFSIQ